MCHGGIDTSPCLVDGSKMVEACRELILQGCPDNPATHDPRVTHACPTAASTSRGCSTHTGDRSAHHVVRGQLDVYVSGGTVTWRMGDQAKRYVSGNRRK